MPCGISFECYDVKNKEKEMKWRPIKTAPTDGTYVLTFDPTAEKDEQIRKVLLIVGK